MKSPALVHICAWALLGMGLTEPASAQSVRIPGTSVSLAPPAGFRVARGFSGLENTATGSSILIVEFPPEAYAELVGIFASPKTASSKLAADGVRITRVEQIATDTGQVPLGIGDQVVKGKEYRKFVTVMGGRQTKSVMITFNIADSQPLGRNEVEAVIRSVDITRVATLDEKLAQLPFSFRAVPPFHTADTLAGATAMLTTFEGTDPSGTKPLIVIGRASTSNTPAETTQTAERVLRETRGFSNAQITERASVPFAAGQGHFIAAAAEGRTILQFLRVLPGGSYIRLIARGDAAPMEEVREAVKQVAASVDLR